MTPYATFFRALPASGKGFALLGSVSAHVAVLLAAVRGAPHRPPNANQPVDRVVEIAELELTRDQAASMPAVSVPVSQPAAAARHHHAYPVPPEHDATPHDPGIGHVLPVRSAATSPPPAPAAVIDSEPPATPHFVISVGSAPHASLGTSAEGGGALTPTEGALAEPAPEASVDAPARLLTGSSASYTREAEQAGVEADVPLEIVVDSKGSVLSARVLSHVGYGLDEAALRNVRAYRFSPARRAGKPLAVRMRWLMRFQLR
jgi:periplasmic protein TonB